MTDEPRPITTIEFADLLEAEEWCSEEDILGAAVELRRLNAELTALREAAQRVLDAWERDTLSSADSLWLNAAMEAK